MRFFLPILSLFLLAIPADAAPASAPPRDGASIEARDDSRVELDRRRPRPRPKLHDAASAELARPVLVRHTVARVELRGFRFATGLAVGRSLVVAHLASLGLPYNLQSATVIAQLRRSARINAQLNAAILADQAIRLAVYGSAPLIGASVDPCAVPSAIVGYRAVQAPVPALMPAADPAPVPLPPVDPTAPAPVVPLPPATSYDPCGVLSGGFRSFAGSTHLHGAGLRFAGRLHR